MSLREYETEYLVVGAGAGGCMLGYLLRNEGKGVLMLELRDAHEKDKLCGGALGVQAIELLETTYGSDAIAELDLCWIKQQKRRTFESEVSLGAGYATMPRKRLDDWLLRRYLEMGGELLDRMRIGSFDMEAHIATAYDLRARETVRISFGTVVGADGASSAVRRLLTGRRQRVIPSFEGIVDATDTDAIFDYHPGRTGYCWYIPAGSKASVGCCLYNESALECRSWLAEFCAQSGFEPSALRGAPIPTGDDVLLAPTKDAWLIGDAAGLISPYLSGGIHHAFESAYYLASALTGGRPYVDAMGPTLDSIAQQYEKLKDYYFVTAVNTVMKGKRFR